MAEYPEFDKQTDEVGDVAPANLSTVVAKLQALINESALLRFPHKGVSWRLNQPGMPPAVLKKAVDHCVFELKALLK